MKVADKWCRSNFEIVSFRSSVASDEGPRTSSATSSKVDRNVKCNYIQLREKRRVSLLREQPTLSAHSFSFSFFYYLFFFFSLLHLWNAYRYGPWSRGNGPDLCASEASRGKMPGRRLQRTRQSSRRTEPRPIAVNLLWTSNDVFLSYSRVSWTSRGDARHGYVQESRNVNYFVIDTDFYSTCSSWPLGSVTHVHAHYIKSMIE